MIRVKKFFDDAVHEHLGRKPEFIFGLGFHDDVNEDVVMKIFVAILENRQQDG